MYCYVLLSVVVWDGGIPLYVHCVEMMLVYLLLMRMLLLLLVLLEMHWMIPGRLYDAVFLWHWLALLMLQSVGLQALP